MTDPVGGRRGSSENPGGRGEFLTCQNFATLSSVLDGAFCERSRRWTIVAMTGERWTVENPASALPRLPERPHTVHVDYRSCCALPAFISVHSPFS